MGGGERRWRVGVGRGHVMCWTVHFVDCKGVYATWKMHNGGISDFLFYEFYFPVKCWCYPSKMKWVLGYIFEKIIGKTSPKHQNPNLAINTSCHKLIKWSLNTEKLICINDMKYMKTFYKFYVNILQTWKFYMLKNNICFIYIKTIFRIWQCS